MISTPQPTAEVSKEYGGKQNLDRNAESAWNGYSYKRVKRELAIEDALEMRRNCKPYLFLLFLLPYPGHSPSCLFLLTFFSRWGTYFSFIFVFQLMFSWCGTGDYCVMKKVKCSGELPCRVCKRKQLDCVFSPKQRPGPKIRMNTACVESSRNGYEKATNIKVPFVEIKSPRCEQPKLLEADSGEDSTYHLTNALLSLKYRTCSNSTIPE